MSPPGTSVVGRHVLPSLRPGPGLLSPLSFRDRPPVTSTVFGRLTRSSWVFERPGCTPVKSLQNKTNYVNILLFMDFVCSHVLEVLCMCKRKEPVGGDGTGRVSCPWSLGKQIVPSGKVFRWPHVSSCLIEDSTRHWYSQVIYSLQCVFGTCRQDEACDCKS